MRALQRLALVIALFAAVYAPAAAQTVPIADASFEVTSPTIGDPTGPYSDNVLSGWTGTGGSPQSFGEWAPNTTPYPGGVPDGTKVAYVNVGSIFQDVPTTLTANTTYTLTGYFGHRADETTTTGSFNLETTSNVLLASSGTVTAPLGQFSFHTVTFTPLASDPNLGQGLRVVLSTVTPQSNFDAISLTASAAAATPEPGAVATLLSMGLAAFNFSVRRQARRKQA